MSTVTVTIHKSKWGYHPYDREQFFFIKKAHKLLFRAYKDAKKWIRWSNKTIYKHEEPECPIGFVETGRHMAGKKTWFGRGFKKYKDKNLYHLVLEAYQVARRPVIDKNQIDIVELPIQLSKIVAELEEFYNENIE